LSEAVDLPIGPSIIALVALRDEACSLFVLVHEAEVLVRLLRIPVISHEAPPSELGG
jgi:hypothetical protein